MYQSLFIGRSIHMPLRPLYLVDQVALYDAETLQRLDIDLESIDDEFIVRAQVGPEDLIRATSNPVFLVIEDHELVLVTGPQGTKVLFGNYEQAIGRPILGVLPFKWVDPRTISSELSQLTPYPLPDFDPTIYQELQRLVPKQVQRSPTVQIPEIKEGPLISYEEAVRKLQNNEIVGHHLYPGQNWMVGVGNRRVTLVSRDGKMYTVEALYDPATSRIYPPN